MTASWRPITPGRANRNLSRLGAKRSVTGEIVSDIPPGPALAISHFAQRRRHCARPRAPNHDRDRAGCEVTSRPLGTGGGSGFPAHRLFPAHDRKATMIVAGQPLVATHDNYPNPAQLTEGLEARVLPGGAVTRHFQTLHQARVTVYSPEMVADSSRTAAVRSSNSATWAWTRPLSHKRFGSSTTGGWLQIPVSVAPTAIRFESARDPMLARRFRVAMTHRS